MNSVIDKNTNCVNQLVVIAPNVPTERRTALGYISTDQASLWDAKFTKFVSEEWGAGNFPDNRTSPQDTACAQLPSNGHLVGIRASNQALPKDVAPAALIPEGRLGGSIKSKTGLSVPSASVYFSTNPASLWDEKFEALVPEGRLVGSIQRKTGLSVPLERLVSKRPIELLQRKGYKKTGKLFVLVFLFAVLLSSCKQKTQPIARVQDKVYYTCSMHPQVHELHPGNCPICGMKLIKVEFTGAPAGPDKNKLVLTAAQIQLAGIQTDTVKEENTGSEKTISGTVTTNENKAEELSAKIAGRIQQLFVRAPGEKISAGQPIYAIYSENLQESEKEYLLAKQQQKVLHNPDVDYAQLISAAENKLLLWGLTPAQIRNLAASGKVSPTVTVYSKVNGTVSDIAVHEGDYVTEGMTILKTQALSSLWVQAQVYASETGYFKVNDQVNVSFPDLNGQVITGKVEFMNPELSDNSKVDLIRISIPNNQGVIRPGMQAYIAMNKGGKRSLAIPASAILSSGTGNTVWVRNSDGSFSMRQVSLGAGNNSFVAIISGLSPGEVVVSNGAYLLNSEYIFKNGDDKKGMAGMKM
ncbi:efflux RND transporter periplasmic adaptor subunit [Mucilaginibacter gotjawali]|uniref:Cu(I)/Ag(I) efflux system membrane fusion protein n=2 Tax=Mucilaginibacter gotjawali TaxID=1550579 RepID=A0A839SJR5_9SPHI|nr:efflux RND transporter periplasmic adaptor subunit [Mucilaginibacter gotjawali]MBB3058096.1 Cu(I)/Ag(I) efflux system membrane fusion protein [Mucilaginibacter gotjawali]BAU52071.1 Cation efflux system protein CusB precursor [Mucilaginibacter gotjawali]